MPQTTPGNKLGSQHGDSYMNTSPFPPLQAARWPAYLTKAGLWILAAGVLIALLSGELNRFSLAGVGTALMTLVVGLGVTVAGTAVAIIGAIAATVKRSPIPGTATVVGIVIGLCVTAYVLSWVEKARSVPPIHDITTDLTNPPAFDEAVLKRRERSHAVNSPEYIRRIPRPGGKILDVPQLQREYYRYIQPLQLALPPDQTLAKARKVAVQMGWRIDAYAPAQGRLEATAHTLFFDFKDDVVVRVTPSGSGSRVDVRSESRVGVSDVGTNAARIRRFLTLMEKP